MTKKSEIGVYWWRNKNGTLNFGDELNATILNSLDVGYRRTLPDDADLVVVGSLLEHLPNSWSGTICGAGKLFPHSKLDLRNAKVLAVRGKLTAAALGATNVVLGDPGLLVPRWIQQLPSKHDLGVVPHWSDTTLYRRFPYGYLIDPTRAANQVAAEIALCKRVISSSLHGLIVADAYGIPRQAELFPNADKEGGDFKYRDYTSIYGDHPHFGEMWTAPYRVVERTQAQLRLVIAEAVGAPVPLWAQKGA